MNYTIVQNPAGDPNVGFPALGPQKGGKGKGKNNNPKGKGKGKGSSFREPQHRNFSNSSERAPGRAQAPSGSAKNAPNKRAPIKLKRSKDHTAALAEDFVAAIEAENPELLSKIRQHTAEDASDQYSIEMSAAPDVKWIRDTERGKTAPRLTEYRTQAQLRSTLISQSGAVASGKDSLQMDLIQEHPVENLTRKRAVFEICSTSREALQIIYETMQGAIWKGYTLRFFQPEESEYGFKFTIPVDKFPEPIKSYSLAQWIEVVHSQGIQITGTTCIKWGKHDQSGAMGSKTNKLEIWLNPLACITHGLAGCLVDAGTEKEKLGEKITYPPSNFAFFRNPVPESVELISDPVDGIKGQYHTADSTQRPLPDDPANGMMEMRTSNTGVLMEQSDLGKLFTRTLVKERHCRHCWGPKHLDRDFECPYDGVCKECLEFFKHMPNMGFHHCCSSLIVDTPKPVKTSKDDRKRKFEENPNPGKPMSKEQTSFTPSAATLAKRSRIEELRVKAQKRHREEQEQAEAEALATATAEAIATKKYEARIQELLLVIKSEREFQALDDSNFAAEIAASAHESFAPPALTEEQQFEADVREAEKRLREQSLKDDTEMNSDDESTLNRLLEEPVTPAPAGMALDATAPAGADTETNMDFDSEL